MVCIENHKAQYKEYSGTYIAVLNTSPADIEEGEVADV